jgi:hypothetical protein
MTKNLKQPIEAALEAEGKPRSIYHSGGLSGT